MHLSGRGQKVLQLQSDTELDAPPFGDNEYLQAFKTSGSQGIAPDDGNIG